MNKFKWIILILAAVSFAAHAGAIDVTYTVSGSPNAWNLNFTVTNTMTAWPAQDIYQFGLMLSAPGVVGSPSGYDPTITASWTNFFNGGGPYFYNNIWEDLTAFNLLLPGSSLSGFVVQISDATPPASVRWFAFSVPDTSDPADIYTGTDAFNIDPNYLTAGFEGAAAEATSTPEPYAMPEILLVVVIGGLGCRKRQHSI